LRWLHTELPCSDSWSASVARSIALVAHDRRRSTISDRA
jgi:hypothetical protein